MVLLCGNLVFLFEQSFHLVGYGVGGLPLQVALWPMNVCLGMSYFCRVVVAHIHHRYISCFTMISIWIFTSTIWVSLNRISKSPSQMGICSMWYYIAPLIVLKRVLVSHTLSHEWHMHGFVLGVEYGVQRYILYFKRNTGMIVHLFRNSRRLTQYQKYLLGNRKLVMQILLVAIIKRC